jgi:hypothetical protein
MDTLRYGFLQQYLPAGGRQSCCFRLIISGQDTLEFSCLFFIKVASRLGDVSDATCYL